MSQPRTGYTAAILRAVIGVYRYALSPLMPPTCRYLPTCSAYAEEAVATHGALKGGWLAVKRVSRCHPLGGHGYDPVPPRLGAGAGKPGRDRKTCEPR